MFDRFGDIRSELHGEPSSARWDRLCALLDGMGGAHLSGRVLPYVRESLERWPDRLRVAPRRWVERLVYSGRCDLITLTKRVSFRHHRLRLDTLEVLLGSPSTRALSFVDLGANVSGAPALEMVADSPALRQGSVRGLGFYGAPLSADELTLLLECGVEWRELAFSDMNMSSRAVELSQHERACSLERLRFDRCQLEGRAATALAASPCMGALEEFGVSDNIASTFVSRLVRTAAYVGSFPRLRALDLSSTNLQAGDTDGLLAWIERSPIESLDLSMAPTVDAFVRALPQAPAFPRLRRVGVMGSLSDLDVLAWLIDAPGASDELRAHALEQLCDMSRPQIRLVHDRDQLGLPF